MVAVVRRDVVTVVRRDVATVVRRDVATVGRDVVAVRRDVVHGEAGCGHGGGAGLRPVWRPSIFFPKLFMTVMNA